MSEFYKDPEDEIKFYRMDLDGRIYELEIHYGRWDEVTDSVEYSPEWQPVTEDYTRGFRLFIYVEQSSRYFKEHQNEVGIDNYEYGDDFTFYSVGREVYAIDNRHDGYLCNPKIMVPMLRKFDLIPEDWYKLDIKTAIEFIENQEGVFLSDMELYYDENGNIQGFTKDLRQFCLNVKTGQLNEVYENIGINNDWKSCSFMDPIFNDPKIEIMLKVDEYDSLRPLYEYVLRSRNEFEKENKSFVFGKEFTYFIDPFGKVYGVDENNICYSCDYDFMRPIENKDNVDECNELLRFYVLEYVERYARYLENFQNMKITLRNTINLQSPDGTIYCLTQDNRWFILSSETGELELLDYEPKIVANWPVIEPRDALKLQGYYKYNYNKNKK